MTVIISLQACRWLPRGLKFCFCSRSRSVGTLRHPCYALDPSSLQGHVLFTTSSQYNDYFFHNCMHYYYYCIVIRISSTSNLGSPNLSRVQCCHYFQLAKLRAMGPHPKHFAVYTPTFSGPEILRYVMESEPGPI